MVVLRLSVEMTFLGIDFAVLRRSIEEDVEMETIGSCDAN